MRAQKGFFRDRTFVADDETGVASPVNFSDSERSAGNSPETEDSSSSSSSGSDASPISYAERVSYMMVPLLNLDGEDWRWNSDSDSDLGCLQDHDLDRSLDFSDWTESPTSQTTDMEDFPVEELLFWPYEKKTKWLREDSSACFPISPRKNISLATHFARKLEAEKGSRRKLSHSPGLATSKAAEGSRSEKRAARNSKTVPSRWSKSSRRLGKIYVAPTRESIENGRERGARRVPAIAKKPSSATTTLLNRESSIETLLNRESSIETWLGLREFDGHEGIDPGFNGAAFSLGEYLTE